MKKITITENHIKLLQQLNWTSNYGFLTGSFIEVEDSDLDRQTDFERHESINLILNGVPDDFDPLNTTELPVFTEEQIAEWDLLFSELPTALDVCLYTGAFETGTYKTRFNVRQWVKIG